MLISSTKPAEKPSTGFFSRSNGVKRADGDNLVPLSCLRKSNADCSMIRGQKAIEHEEVATYFIVNDTRNTRYSCYTSFISFAALSSPLSVILCKMREFCI